MSKLFRTAQDEAARIEQETFLRSHDGHRGHPTAPGRPDPQEVRTVEGRTPRVRPSPLGHGPGIPGMTPTGPHQPGTIYENPYGDDPGF
jgi:hypothetical protein